MALALRRTVVPAIFLLAAFAVVGCTEEQEPPPGTEPVPSHAVEAITDLGEMVDESVEPAEAAEEGTEPAISSTNLAIEGSSGTQAEFLTAVLNDIDAYWTDVVARDGSVPSPYIQYLWMAPGESFTIACTDEAGNQVVTDDESAAYCPADDTVYVSQQFTYNLWSGYIDSPSQGPTYSQYLGDFAVAYVLAHEYAHNLQNEWRLLDPALLIPTINIELMADCMAGNWANSAFYRGILEPGDIEEAIAAADLVGDYNFTDPGHHGTPEERMAAFSLGYNTGDTAECIAYVG
jgi:predicted metalloprotease